MLNPESMRDGRMQIACADGNKNLRGLPLGVEFKVMLAEPARRSIRFQRGRFAAFVAEPEGRFFLLPPPLAALWFGLLCWHPRQCRVEILANAITT